MNDKLITKFDYSKKISELRNQNSIDVAIEVAKEASQIFLKENIFEKLLGDLFFQKSDYMQAGESYIRFLNRIYDNPEYFKHFAQFWQKLIELDNPEQIIYFTNLLYENIKNRIYSDTIQFELCFLIYKQVKIEEISLFSDDANFKKVVKYLRYIQNSPVIYIIFYKVIDMPHIQKNKRIDKFIVSLMEKLQQNLLALRLVSIVLIYDNDQVAVRTLFRLCRKINDYSWAENYISTNPEIKCSGSFNIQYELVYYFASKSEKQELHNSLNIIEKSANSSLPILRTLYNFYLQFGMADKASEVSKKILSLENNKNHDRKEQERDSELGLVKTINELFKELEHSRKMISMSELLKGFSHELGQPITNIRYGIQLYQMKMKNGLTSDEILIQLFDDILSQTLRIKGLLDRFSPVVSEKNNEEHFSVVKRIMIVYDEFKSRLNSDNITLIFNSTKDIQLYGDCIKFDQIIYNLIGNSIYAIKEKKNAGIIRIHTYDKEDKFIITFSDNGVGINPEHYDKVFEPFFTTKEENTVDGGGEGLGLYIIWNIVRMFNGIIKIDKQYQDGAKFIIEIDKRM